MVTTPLKMPILGQSVQKLHSYAVLQHMCTLFTCPTRFAVEFATPWQFRIGGICRCYGNHTPKIVKNCYFCAFVSPQTFCAHFSYVSNDSHLTSTHTRNSSLRISAVAMATPPLKLSKIGVFAHLCPPRHFVHTFHMTQTIHIWLRHKLVVPVWGYSPLLW